VAVGTHAHLCAHVAPSVVVVVVLLYCCSCSCGRDRGGGCVVMVHCSGSGGRCCCCSQEEEKKRGCLLFVGLRAQEGHVVEDVCHRLFCGPGPWQAHLGQQWGPHFV